MNKQTRIDEKTKLTPGNLEASGNERIFQAIGRDSKISIPLDVRWKTNEIKNLHDVFSHRKVCKFNFESSKMYATRKSQLRKSKRQKLLIRIWEKKTKVYVIKSFPSSRHGAFIFDFRELRIFIIIRTLFECYSSHSCKFIIESSEIDFQRLSYEFILFVDEVRIFNSDLQFCGLSSKFNFSCISLFSGARIEQRRIFQVKKREEIKEESRSCWKCWRIHEKSVCIDENVLNPFSRRCVKFLTYTHAKCLSGRYIVVFRSPSVNT